MTHPGSLKTTNEKRRHLFLCVQGDIDIVGIPLLILMHVSSTAAYIRKAPALFRAELMRNIHCESLIRVGSPQRHNKILRSGLANNHMTRSNGSVHSSGRGSGLKCVYVIGMKWESK